MVSMAEADGGQATGPGAVARVPPGPGQTGPGESHIEQVGQQTLWSWASWQG